MSAVESPGLSPEAVSQALSTHLFPEDGELQTYAVLDGASVPDLLDRLYGDEPPEFVCLYRGELEPDLAEVAPYLVHLKPKSPFTEWLLGNCWGNHWGIFAMSTEDIDVIRRHFRNFLFVQTPKGESVYFRYYDPRVLTVYLPTANADELDTVFGPILTYVCESRENELIALSQRDGKLNQTRCIALDSAKIA